MRVTRWISILVMASALVILVACGGGDDDDASTTTSAGTTPEAEASVTQSASEPTQSDANFPDVHVPLQVGSSGKVESSNPDPFVTDEEMGTVKVTIVAIMDPAETESAFFQPEAGNKYWAVEITMEATGDKPINTGVWTLRTSDGSEYENIYITEVGEDIPYGSIEPGSSKQGVIVFEIPRDATIQWLHMDPSIYVGGNLFFDA